MIKWYSNLYVDEIVAKKKKNIMKLLDKNKPTIGIYCLALSSNENNLFDIINVNELLFKHYKKNDIYIIGLAFGKDSMIEILINVIEEVYKNTGDFDMKSYFKFN